MLQPKVGDTVVCEFEVTGVFGGTFTFTMKNGGQSCLLSNSRILEIKPQPFKVGDTVWWVDCDGLYGPSGFHGSTLIYIHDLDGRKFAVVAYQGDIPKSIWFKDLRRSLAECAV